MTLTKGEAMDTIEKLAERLFAQFQINREAFFDAVRREAERLSIAVQPQPPEPGSLWEHNETGERRFITAYPCGGEVNFASWSDQHGERHACSDVLWHRWAVNAKCLCEGMKA